MKPFKVFLSEKRKNPLLNIKRSAYRELKPWKDRKDIYISLRDINKLGINPQSEYDTPSGVYGYPLWLVWDLIDSKETLKGLPFAGKEPYIYAFKPKFNPIMLGDLSRSWVEDFITKVISKPNYKLFFIDGDIVGDIKEIEKYLNTIEKLNKSTETEKEYSTLFDMYNIDIMPKFITYLKNKGMLLKDVLEGDTITDDFIKELNSYKQKLSNDLKELKDKANINLDPKEIYEQGKKEALVNSTGGIFWWVTYKIAGHNINKWNALFREFDIHGVVDNGGEGIIHENEPVQAVFFDKTKLKVLQVINNKDYKEKINTMRQFIHNKMKGEISTNDIAANLVGNFDLFRSMDLNDLLLFLDKLKINPIKKTLYLKELLLKRILVSFMSYSNYSGEHDETKKTIQNKINEIFKNVGKE